MRKIFTKFICLAVSAVTALGITFASACSGYKPTALSGDISGTVLSNGGFAVEKGKYIYFINGKETYEADNTLGTPVKGSIMRISKEQLGNRNYESVETVVPQIAYSGNSNAGLFIYGDYIYYATPLTDTNSEGEVFNSYISFKRAKLDGSEVMKDYYVRYSNNSIEYRYVEVGDTVYLIYVATEENLYGTSCTNIHSYNTSTGKDTLLAYNVDSYVFDKTDVKNPRIYYTMKVQDFELNKTYGYNQIYTVSADIFTPNEYNFDNIEDYDAETDPLYVNCGKLVFDGIGYLDDVTQFNGKDADKAAESSYTYTLSSYQNGKLFFSRTSKNNSTAVYFNVSDSEVTADNWNPVTANSTLTSFLTEESNSSLVSSFNYFFDANGGIESVIITDSKGMIKATPNAENKISTVIDNYNTYYISSEQATVLFTDADYIYYSVTGGNGYTFNRIRHDGGFGDYNKPFNSETDDYTGVRILDIDSVSDWYKPEMFDGQILFPSALGDMTDYAYIMACDLRVYENGVATDKVMSNAEIEKYTEYYNEIEKQIDKVDESIYANLKNALRYVFYTGDSKYIETLNDMYAKVEDGATYINDEGEEVAIVKYTIKDNALEKVAEFFDNGGDWSEYSKTVKVNGAEVKANRRTYYYSLLGKMSDADAEGHTEYIRTTYLKEEPPVSDESWFDSLSSGEQTGFIIGMVALGLVVIGGGVGAYIIIRKKHKDKHPEEKKKRIKVDTTDDKDIDVYNN